MSHSPLRLDKQCTNCNTYVEHRFCPVCGQENTETRQSFGGLIAHFAEDLTHYEGKFWVTLKYLFFRPAFLTKEYLSGKRVPYVPPVRLYIFVSFVTFLLPHVIPSVNDQAQKEYTPKELAEIDSVRKTSSGNLVYDDDLGLILRSDYKTLKEIDSVYESLKGGKGEMNFLKYKMERKGIELNRYSPNEVMSLFETTLGKNIPKTLLIFMPLFAFIIWLFNSKKKYWYFDHAVFTLHFFSFILLLFSIAMLLITGLMWFYHFTSKEVYFDVSLIIGTLVFVYCTVYYFIAYFNMYNGKLRWLKSFFSYVLNLALFAYTFVVLLLITILTLH